MGNAKADDMVNVVSYSPEFQVFYVYENVAARDALTATITLPANLVATAVEAYAFLYKSTSKTSGNSVYLGSIALE